jgi:phosphonate transport system ATP-binding protein
MPPMIRAEAMGVTYPNGTQALAPTSVEIAAGRFTVLLGPSGAGKSTLLRCLNGILPVTSGSIVINGVDVTVATELQRRQLRQRIGFVYQEFNLVDRSTAFRNVIAGRLGQMSPWLSVVGIFRPEDRLAALACLDRVQLLHRAAQRADRLSGGEKQRVSIARALAQEPWLILADEPVASLDPELSREVMGFLRKVASEEKVPVLVNIHDVALAQEYSDRVIGIAEGRIEYDGPARELTAEDQRRIYRRDPRTLVQAPEHHAAGQTDALAKEVGLGDLTQ